MLQRPELSRLISSKYYDFKLGVSNQDFPGSQGIDQPVNDKNRYEPWNAVYIEWPSLMILHPLRKPFKHEHDDSSFWHLSYLSVGVPWSASAFNPQGWRHHRPSSWCGARKGSGGNSPTRSCVRHLPMLTVAS
jgi:hypothetical protein